MADAMDKIPINAKIILFFVNVFHLLFGATPTASKSGITYSRAFLFNYRYIEEGIYNNTHNDTICDKNKMQDSLLPVILNGYIQVRYSINNGMDNSFDIRRARLSLKGYITKKLNYKLQTEFSGSKQKLLDAELNFDIHPFLQLTAGQFKIPFSYENLISSSNLGTIDRSQIVEALTARGKDVIGNQSGRDIGLMINGIFNIITDFEYFIGAFNGSGINTIDMNKQKDLIGRIIVHPQNSFSLGSSFYLGRYTADDSLRLRFKRERIGLELVYKNLPISLSAEYIWGKDNMFQTDGWYMQAGYFIIPKKFELLTKYDIYNLNIEDYSSAFYTIAINLFFTEKSKWQINYQLRDEQESGNLKNFLITQIQYGF